MISTKRLSLFNTKIVGFVALALVSFGRSGFAAARSANAERGIIEARGPVAKVVAVGPIALHAYSQFVGGSLYTAPAVTGTDRDCQGSASATPVLADRIATFAVGKGQVACLKTTTKGSFELLWHAVSQPVHGRVVVRQGGPLTRHQRGLGRRRLLSRLRSDWPPSPVSMTRSAMRRLLHCLYATLLVVCFAARAGAEETAPPTFGHSGQWTFSVAEALGIDHSWDSLTVNGQLVALSATSLSLMIPGAAVDLFVGHGFSVGASLRLVQTSSRRCDYQHQPASRGCRRRPRPARGRRFLDRSCGRASHRLRRAARALGGNLAARGHQHRILLWQPIERRRHRTGRNDQHPRRVDRRSPLGVPSNAARRRHCRANLRSQPLDKDHHNRNGGRPERHREGHPDRDRRPGRAARPTPVVVATEPELPTDPGRPERLREMQKLAIARETLPARSVPSL